MDANFRLSLLSSLKQAQQQAAFETSAVSDEVVFTPAFTKKSIDRRIEIVSVCVKNFVEG